jgi:hypothetical protein
LRYLATPPMVAYTFDTNPMNAEETTISGQCFHGASVRSRSPKSFANEFQISHSRFSASS